MPSWQGMDVKMANPLETLRRLPGTALMKEEDYTDPNQDPSITNHLFNQAMQRELVNRKFAAERTSQGPEANALAGLLKSYQTEDAMSPISKQRSQIEEIERAQNEAQTQGFESPQSQFSYQRKMEEEKMRQPLRQQELVSKTNLDVAGLQGKNVMEAERLRQQGAIDLQDRYNQFIQGLGGASQQGAGQVAGATFPSRTGGGSIRFDTNTPQSVPTALLRDIAALRQEVARTGETTGPMGFTSPSGPKAALDQAIASAVSVHPAHPALKEWIAEVAKDPAAAKLSIDQIIQMQGEDSLSPDEIAQLQDLSRIVRGF